MSSQVRSHSRLSLTRLPVSWLLILPLLALVVAMFGSGLVDIAWLSVTEPVPGPQNYLALVENETVARLLATTVRVCLITTIVSVALGYVVAYAITHARNAVQQRMLLLLLISFWIPVLVRTFSWLMLLGTRGPINGALVQLGLIDQPLALVRNEFGVLVGMIHYMTPYAVLPLLASMQSVDERVIRASQSLGATGRQTFWRVYLPLTRPGLISSAVLVFILSLGFYITPAVLGGGKVLMVAEYISVQVLVLVRWGIASMLAVSMLIVVMLLLMLMSRYMKLTAALSGGR